MMSMLLYVPIFLPILGGVALKLSRSCKPRLIEALVLFNSLLVWLLLLTGTGSDSRAVLFRLAGGLDIFCRLDGMAKVFAGLVSFLWPLATLYSFEYMEHDERKTGFFAFYTMTYGVTLGVAMSGNLVTLYLFYELLTLVTFPLVLHYRNEESRQAARIYLYYSIGGAALAFIGLIFVLVYGTTTDFVYGGVLTTLMAEERRNLLLAMYVLAFLGFGVKAAVFPMSRWLPAASVAPTPVTALLHAVAVVKSGAFAIMRLTYFSYGAGFLWGTWAQYVVAALVLITVAHGSTMAVREVHFKKRLAFSTISNLSYVLLGVVMMSPAGLYAALSHLVFHAIMKICGFFCVGAVMHKTDCRYVYQLNGIGRKMPVTFACFTSAACSLMGFPLFAGFISKWNIAQAAVGCGGTLGVIAVSVLLYSALMTCIYMMTVVVRAWFPANEDTNPVISSATDPTWRMLLPLVVFAVLLIVLGVHPAPLTEFFSAIAEGVL